MYRTVLVGIAHADMSNVFDPNHSNFRLASSLPVAKRTEEELWLTVGDIDNADSSKIEIDRDTLRRCIFQETPLSFSISFSSIECECAFNSS